MNIKKISAILAAVFTLASATSVGAKTVEFAIGSSQIYIRDAAVESKSIDSPAYIESSRTMVPIRAVVECFGADISWNGETREAVIKNGSTEIVLPADSTTAYVNGNATQLDVPTVIVNDRVMVPLRFVSETLGKSVEYVDASKQVLISDDKPAIVVNGRPITADDYLSFMALNGVDATSPYLSHMINEITNTLVPLMLFSDKATKDGYFLTEAQGAELTDSLSEYKNTIYSTALLAPAVKTLSNDLLTYTYLKENNYYASEEDVANYYNTNYVTAKHILLVFPENKDGSAPTDEQKSHVKTAMNQIKARLDAGEDFDTLMNEYCEDPGLQSYPQGYTFTRKEMVAEFETAAFAMSVGEVSDVIETPYGYHIIKKEPLAPISQELQNNIFDALTAQKQTQALNNLVAEATIESVMTADELMAILAPADSTDQQ